MSNRPLTPHLHPQEIARRQRWVTVGVTILGLLLIVTWFVTLPARISKSAGGALIGEIPKSTFIDTDAIINSDARKNEEQKLLESVTELTKKEPATTETVTTTPVTAATTTPTSVPNKK